MSQKNASRFGQHGFCNAIFSSSPFDKENKPPNTESTPNGCKESTAGLSCKKNLINFLPPNELNIPKKDNVRQNNSKHPKNNDKLLRSQSTTMLQEQEPVSIKKFTSEEKLKVLSKHGSSSRLSGEKTPVTHFCTPKSVNEQRSNSHKKPIKRFFSENNLPQTPDCFNSVQLETPRAKNYQNIDEQTVYEGESSNLTVGIRVRPLNFKEQNEPKIYSIIEVNDQNITVDCDTSQHTFTYDHCFISHIDSNTPNHSNQEILFKSMVLPLVQNAFEGYNVCLFAYGQTGSGKSYSMMGAEPSQPNSNEINPDAGIIPRFCHEIFSKISKSKSSITVEISYFEIYNEKIHDLLISNNSNKRAPLKVREHPVLGPYIVDLSQHSVQNYDDLKAWLKVGNSQRATAATGMNEKSSRSHSIFSIVLTQEKLQETLKNKDDVRRSKINLVDLAGSERISNTCASGDRLREGVSINKSLLTLGKVIGCLAENTNNRKRGFVPYRDSVLTWLLKESLGGNSRTAMLGTVSPANIHLEETLATLRYACQARAIVNRVKINEDPHDRLIRQLKAEIQRLKNMRSEYERQTDKVFGSNSRRLFDGSVSPVSDGSEEVLNKQREIDELKNQLKNMEEQMSNCQNSIENKHGSLTLFPEKDAECFVNGQLIYSKVSLKHGDRLVIGGNHYFKICNPNESKDEPKVSSQPIDFEYAHQEILRIQEEKLRNELEDSKKKAMKELENAKKEVEMQLDSQKLAYESEIKKLGHNLEEQKQALEEVNKKKKELEKEKQLLANELELERFRSEECEKNISPYKTDFLEKLEEILNEKTADIETALTVKTSIDAMKTGGVSLHEIQLLVREATERCRDVGVNYEFHQQQIIVDKGLQPVIRVRDKDTMTETLWEPMRFLDWIHKLRDHELEHSMQDLRDPDDKWEPFEDSDIMPDSLYNSRISINMTPVKKHLNESLSQFSFDGSFLDSSTADQTCESVVQKRRDDINQCLIQMEIASRTMKGLCHQYESREISGKVTQSLDKVQLIINNLRTIIENKSIDNFNETESFYKTKFNNTTSKSIIENKSIDDTTNKTVNGNKSNANSIIADKSNIENSKFSDSNIDIIENDTSEKTKTYFPKIGLLPAKSNLRNACPIFKNETESRTVRFDIKK